MKSLMKTLAALYKFDVLDILSICKASRNYNFVCVKPYAVFVVDAAAVYWRRYHILR